MLSKHKDSLCGRQGPFQTTHLTIDLKDKPCPIRQQSYRAGQKSRELFRVYIDKPMEVGVIESAQSAWVVSIALITEKDCTLYFRGNYRRFNEATVLNTYLLPPTADCISSLRESHVFTEVDDSWGYWQLPIKDEYNDKTIIASHLGTYRCSLISFDLRNAPSLFQHALDIILSLVR